MDLPKSTLSQLDDDNYGNWRTRILAGLTIKGLKHAISVDADVDEDDDDKARSYLILSCKDHLLPFIKDLDTARAIWVKLESIYQASSKAKVNEVRRQLAGLKKSPKEPVSRYLSRAELLRDQLLFFFFFLQGKGTRSKGTGSRKLGNHTLRTEEDNKGSRKTKEGQQKNIHEYGLQDR